MVKVNALEVEEATNLFLNGVIKSILWEKPYRQLVKEVADCLHWNALAMDPAAARIEVDVEDGEDLALAFRGYLSDYRYNYERLRLDRDFADAGKHVKTVRTASAVSLSSLRQTYDSRPNSSQMELLSFITPSIEQAHRTSFCRLGSLGLDKACKFTTWLPHGCEDSSARTKMVLGTILLNITEQ